MNGMLMLVIVFWIVMFVCVYVVGLIRMKLVCFFCVVWMWLISVFLWLFWNDDSLVLVFWVCVVSV